MLQLLLLPILLLPILPFLLRLPLLLIVRLSWRGEWFLREAPIFLGFFLLFAASSPAAQKDANLEALWGVEASFGAYHERSAYALPLFGPRHQNTKLTKEALLLATGLSVGPFSAYNFSVAGAYALQQEWYSDTLRSEALKQGPPRLTGASWPSNHSERQHDWQLLATYQPWQKMGFGLWQEVRLRTLGPSLLSAEEATMANASSRLSDQIATLPWLSYLWQGSHQSWLGLYFYKDYDYLLPDKSLQTYHLASKAPLLSVMMAHRWLLPLRWPSTLVAGGSLLRLRANDPWQELRRQRLWLTGSLNLGSNINIFSILKLERDSYEAPYLLPVANGQPSWHDRRDRGLSLHGGFSYVLASVWEIGAAIGHWKNRSDGYKDKEFSRNSVIMTVSLAFPKRKPLLVPPWLGENEYLQNLQKRLEFDVTK